jgi:hypothetical protein
MKLVNLTTCIRKVNAAIDTGTYDDVSLEEVHQHIENGDLFPYLASRLEGNIDLSLLGERVSGEINDELGRILDAYGGQERRKWGVENNGLCLVVAWLNELIQQRVWTD